MVFIGTAIFNIDNWQIAVQLMLDLYTLFPNPTSMKTVKHCRQGYLSAVNVYDCHEMKMGIAA